MVSEPVVESSAYFSPGELMNLTCTFQAKKNFSSNPFVVYWIKSSGSSSVCLYSYQHSSPANDGLHKHCSPGLVSKTSTTTQPLLQNHNLILSDATYSDNGQYVCVLQVYMKAYQHWRIITNTTIIVEDHPASVQPGKNMQFTPE